MPERNDGTWLAPPERALTRTELRAVAASAASSGERRIRIGEVSTRIGLSVRSIRYYEETGLVAPSARTPGGFRLYTEADVSRLLLIMQMKPLGFSLDEMREVFAALDALGNVDDASAATDLEAVLADVESRLEALRRQVGVAESFRRHLRSELRLDPGAMDPRPGQGSRPQVSAGTTAEAPIGTTRRMRTDSTRRPSIDSTVNE